MILFRHYSPHDKAKKGERDSVMMQNTPNLPGGGGRGHAMLVRVNSDISIGHVLPQHGPNTMGWLSSTPMGLQRLQAWCLTESWSRKTARTLGLPALPGHLTPNHSTYSFHISETRGAWTHLCHTDTADQLTCVTCTFREGNDTLADGPLLRKPVASKSPPFLHCSTPQEITLGSHREFKLGLGAFPEPRFIFFL